ncbi:MAG TPA: glycosyltransferase family 2 protein, partial [Gemmatimonadaceae bacterium]|nr:glycosyltransferase family 2 protein [Gemmatimonadaceae bacterium]
MSDIGSVPVTVVIAAKNEAANIEACVASVRWAREIIVVENDSSDDTIGLAQNAGATVMSNPFTTIGAQRNAAIERAASDWVLVVDADERGSPTLGEEIARIISSPGGHDAFRIPRRNFFLGREVKHGGWASDRPIRLFRSSIRYNASRVHEHVEVNGSISELHESLLHSTYTSLDDYFEKLDRYSRWWAEDRFDRGRRAGAGAVVFRPPARFVSMYFLRGGWMDGAP